MWNKDTRGAYKVALVVILLALVALVSGCAVSPERRPYMEVGMAYDTQHTVGNNPQCVVRIRQPIGFGRLEPDWLTIGYQHQSSCPDQRDRNTVDAIEIVAKIPLGRESP
jgi:hypothetical protein